MVTCFFPVDHLFKKKVNGKDEINKKKQIQKTKSKKHAVVKLTFKENFLKLSLDF